MKITKLHLVEVPKSELQDDGIVAFQMVKFEYEFYGQKLVDVLDTKIMENGDQFVTNGNGFIKWGTKI
jgi:hypothetical protein